MYIKRTVNTIDDLTPFDGESAVQYEKRAVRQLRSEQKRLSSLRLRPGYRPKTPAEATEMSAIYRKLAKWNVEIIKNTETLREKELHCADSLVVNPPVPSPREYKETPATHIKNDTLLADEIVHEHSDLHTPKPVHVSRNMTSENREWRRKFSCKYAESVTSTFYNSREFSTQARGYGNSVGGDNIAWGGAFGPAPHSVTPQHSFRPHPSPGGTSRQVLENVDVQKRGDVDEEKLTSPGVDVISNTYNAVPRARDVCAGTTSPIALGLGAWKTCIPLVPPKAQAVAVANPLPTHTPVPAVAMSRGLAWDLPESLVAAILAVVDLGMRSRQLLTMHVDDEDAAMVADLWVVVGSDKPGLRLMHQGSRLVRVYSAVTVCLWEPLDAPHAISAAAIEAKRQIEARKTIWPITWRGYRQQGDEESARRELQRVIDLGHVAVIDSRAG